MIGGVLGDRLIARNAARTPDAVARWMIRIQVRLWGNRLADLVFQMMSRTRAVYVNEWHPAIRAALSPERMHALLDDVRGGRIGLTGVREVVFGVADIDREIERWQALLEPVDALGIGHWRLPSGPAIRLEASQHPSGRMICVVNDFEAAAAFLRREELLGNSTDGELQIAPGALAGLDIRLVPA